MCLLNCGLSRISCGLYGQEFLMYFAVAFAVFLVDLLKLTP